MIDLSVVVPAYDEEGNLPSVVTRVLKELDRIGVTSELVLVDDGSSDASPRLIAAAAREHPGRVVAVLKPANAGQHAAILSGFAAAHGRQFVTLDADPQNPPEEIGRVFAELEKASEKQNEFSDNTVKKTIVQAGSEDELLEKLSVLDWKEIPAQESKPGERLNFTL